jgi:hypothetical protein
VSHAPLCARVLYLQDNPIILKFVISDLEISICDILITPAALELCFFMLSSMPLKVVALFYALKSIEHVAAELQLVSPASALRDDTHDAPLMSCSLDAPLMSCSLADPLRCLDTHGRCISREHQPCARARRGYV